MAGANPSARNLGNALKRVQDKRVDGLPFVLARKLDGHGFALWQVVGTGRASDTKQPPRNAELVHSALTGMGYRSAEATFAVSSLGISVDTLPLADAVREALATLVQRAGR
jgi:Holliday junction resolvasome RuvABC DNA-binding subunit